MNRQERKDAALYGLGEGIWGLGIGLVAPLTVLPLLIRQLGGGPLEIGWIYAMATAGFLLTQPVGTLLAAHGGGKRGFLLGYHAATVLPLYAAMAAVIWFVGSRAEGRTAARLLLLSLFSLRVLLTGPIVPLWQDWVAGLFSTQSRGRAVGFYMAAAAVGVSVGAVAAAHIRGRYSFPVDCALLFAGATVVLAISIASFLLVSPGQARPDAAPPTVPGLLARFRWSLRDANYRRYLAGRVLLTLGSGATAFVAVHYRSPEGGSLSDATIIGLGGVLTLTQAGGSLWLGALGDRSGHRAGVLVGAIAQMAALAVAFVGTGVTACVLCFACLGLAYASGNVSHQNMIFETCPHDNRVAHITLSNVVLSPFMAAIPLATAYLVSHIGTLGAFAACTVPTMLGTLWLTLLVSDPRAVELGPARLGPQGTR